MQRHTEGIGLAHVESGRGFADLLPLARDEEVCTVAPDRPAGREAPAGGGEFRGCRDIVDDQFTDQPAPAVEAEGGGLELVGSRFGHGVERAAGEAGLANVEGRDIEPELLDGIEGDHAAAGPSPRDAVR